MADAKLLVSAGDVLDVQLTSETVVIDTPMGRRAVAEPGHITNRMRLFVKDLDGREQVYDFEETELGVRETQRVAIVRAQIKREPAPLNLMLFNLTAGQHDTFEGGLRVYLGRKPFFGPLWKATGFSLLTGLIVWLACRYAYHKDVVTTGFLTVAAAMLLFPAYVWLCRAWDRITEAMRYRAARARFIAEMSARVQGYAGAGAA